MLERFLLATVATFSLSLLVHGIPQITITSGQRLDVNAKLLPTVGLPMAEVAWPAATP